VKIGITLDMSISFWANGMQQNIVFLYSVLERAGFSCFYITNKQPSSALNKRHKGLLLDDVMRDDSESFDVLLIAGFNLLPDMYERLKSRNSGMKIIFVHFGNKLMDDIHYAISFPETRKEPIAKTKYIDAVWVYPHHNFSKSYLSSYYEIDNIVEVPYIWDSFFLEDKVKVIKSKGFNPFFQKKDQYSACVFEPNISHIKNCIIPINICETFDKLFPGELKSVNIFSCEHLRKRPFFNKLMKNMRIVNKDNFCFFNNKWGFADAVSKFGEIIITHQSYSELNYLYFESLYLGLPLVHNSSMIQEYGYYYPEFEVDFGAKQLKVILESHEKCIDKYKEDSKKLFKEYSPYNQLIIDKYRFSINDLFK
jgi:hypothetical protein